MRSITGLFCLIIVSACCGIYGCSGTDVSYYGGEAKVSVPFGRNYNYEDILVSRVVDGDTLVLENGQRVRLIGIDTPEVHMSEKLYSQAQRSKTDIQTIMNMGKRASQFTRSLVEGKRVRIEFDAEKYDKYGRLLCYVYLKDGTFVNAEIVRQGYASLLTIPPNVKYADLFRALYQEARENNRGLWKEE